MMRKLLLPLLLSLSLAEIAQAAPPVPAPAPLEIVSAEFGLFDASNPQELAFEPSNVVPRREGQHYGWVIELRTSKRTVTVSEEYLLPPLKQASNTPPKADKAMDPMSESLDIPTYRRSQVSQRQLAPMEGRIYGEWAVGPKEPPGHRRLQVLVEGQVAATFEYDVQ